ncbi:MAG: hypothetical protein RLZZ378_619, partial [Actinomycetota bacterium]
MAMSNLSKDQIELDLADGLKQIAQTEDLEQLKSVKISVVGDKSALARANQSLGTLAAE